MGNDDQTPARDEKAAALSQDVIIPNARGLHARASARFVTCARDFDAAVEVGTGGRSVSADSIMELLMLAAAKGTNLTISAQGPDAAAAVQALCALVADGFGET